MKLVILVALGCCLVLSAWANPLSDDQDEGQASELRPQQFLQVPVEILQAISDQDQEHNIQKRQTQGGNSKPGSCYRPRRQTTGFGSGNARGAVGGNRPTTSRPYCRSDYECSGNKKCCSGACSTPSFTG